GRDQARERVGATRAAKRPRRPARPAAPKAPLLLQMARDPGAPSLAPDQMLSLQAAYGNQAVARAASEPHTALPDVATPPLQRDESPASAPAAATPGAAAPEETRGYNIDFSYPFAMKPKKTQNLTEAEALKSLAAFREDMYETVQIFKHTHYELQQNREDH